MNRNMAVVFLSILFIAAALYAKIIDVEKEPVVVKKVAPNYPEKAFRQGVEGRVIVAVLVDVDGKPKEAKVVKTSNEIFNEAATEAAKQWLFSPAILNKTPVKFWFQIPIDFKLTKNDSLFSTGTLLVERVDSARISYGIDSLLKVAGKEAVPVPVGNNGLGAPEKPAAARKETMRKDPTHKDKVILLSPADYIPAYGEPQQVDESAVLLHRVEPNYPPIAHANRIEGRVVLALLLGTDGKVLDVKVVRSSNEIFNEDAIACGKQWVFKPAILKGNPVKSWHTDSLDFRIK